MIKLFAGTLIVVVLAGLGVYCYSSNVTVRAWSNRAEQGIAATKSNEQLLVELKIHISDLSKGISEHELKLIKTQRLVKAMEDDLQKCRVGCDEHIMQLAEAKKILAGSSTEITVVAANPGRKLSRADVEADVKKRLHHLAHLKTLIETKETSLHLLKATLENGKKALNEAAVVKDQKIVELNTLAQRLKNAEHLNEIRSLTDDLKASFASMQSTQFQKSWREMLDRVDSAEINIKNAPTQSGLIDYREAPDATADLIRAIEDAIETPKTVGTK